MLVEDVRAMNMTPVETEAESCSITVDLRHVDKEVEAGADAPNDKPIETVEPPKWGAVNALVDPDSTTVNVRKGLDWTTVDALGESGNASVDALGKPFNATLPSDREPYGTTVEPGEPDNMNIDVVEESNNTTLDVPLESDNATFQVLEESDNGIDVPREAMVMGVHITEVDPASDDMMDLDILEAGSRGRESIDAASALYSMSQHSPQSSGGLDTWQMVNWPKKTHQQGQQEQVPKLVPTGIDPKELLEGWDWAFQRR